MRPEIEHPEEILDLSKDKLVAVLIVGDPLQATTRRPPTTSYGARD